MLEQILVEIEGGAMWDRYFRVHWQNFSQDEGRPEAVVMAVAEAGEAEALALMAAAEAATAFWR